MLSNYTTFSKPGSGRPASTSFSLDTAALGTMMVETPVSAVPQTAITVDGQSVGLWYDQSVNAAIIGATTRPVLGSGTGRNSWLRWNGTSTQMHVISSVSYFNKFFTASPSASIGIQIKMMGGDGSQLLIIDNVGGNVAAAVGMEILRTTGNKVLCRAAIGGGTVIWTVTSTTNINVAAGWLTIVVSLAGVGTGTGLLEIYNAGGTLIESQTFNIAAGTTASNAGQVLTIGTRANASDQFLNAQISRITMWNGPAIASQRQAFASLDPARYSTFTPVLQWKVDASDSRFIYSDDTGNTQVTNGQAARTIRSQTLGNWDIPANIPYQNLRRIFLTASSGVSAVWNSAGQQSYLDFDGVDDNYTITNSGVLFEEVGGRWTYVRVAKNNDATYGSHLFSYSGSPAPANNGFYHVLTGSAYSVPLPTNPRQVLHPNPNVNPLNIPSENIGVDDIKISVWVRDGASLTGYDGDGNSINEPAFTSALTFNQWGLAYTSVGSNFNEDAHDFYFEKWNGVQDATWIANKIAELRLRFP
jgi:hypothetical protein